LPGIRSVPAWHIACKFIVLRFIEFVILSREADMRRNCLGLFSVALSLLISAASPLAAAPLTIGYSDWPGWVAWQVAIDKGWLKEAGVPVSFEWVDYSASMDAFSAGQIE